MDFAPFFLVKFVEIWVRIHFPRVEWGGSKSFSRGCCMSDQPVTGGAVLYTVQGPRGSYYAIHDPATGRICTESSDPRARAQAREMGLIVVNEEKITHQELLRRTG